MLSTTLGYEHNFLHLTILRVLRKHKFINVKSTIKSNLIETISRRVLISRSNIDIKQ